MGEKSGPGVQAGHEAGRAATREPYRHSPGLLAAAALLCSGCYPMYVNSFPEARSIGPDAVGADLMASYAGYPSSGPVDDYDGGVSTGNSDFSCPQIDGSMRFGLPAGLELGLGASPFSMAEFDQKYQFLGGSDPAALAMAVDLQEQDYIWGSKYQAYSLSLVAQKRIASHLFLDLGIRPGYFVDQNYTNQYPDTFSLPNLSFSDDSNPAYPIEPTGCFGDGMVGVSSPINDNIELRAQLIARFMLPDKRTYTYLDQYQTEYPGPYEPVPSPSGYTYTYSPVWTFQVGVAWSQGSWLGGASEVLSIVYDGRGVLYVDGVEKRSLRARPGRPRTYELRLSDAGFHRLVFKTLEGPMERDVDTVAGRPILVSFVSAPAALPSNPPPDVEEEEGPTSRQLPNH